MIHYNDVDYDAADMQTQDTARHDKYQTFTTQQNTITSNNAINDDTNPQTFDVSSYIMPSGSRDLTLYEEPNEETAKTPFLLYAVGIIAILLNIVLGLFPSAVLDLLG